MLIISLVLVALYSNAMEVGEVQIAGNICQQAVGAHSVEKGIDEGTYIIPLGVYLKKDNSASLARGSCTFAMSVTADAHKRIRVQQAQQFFSLKSFENVNKVKIDLEVFRAGERGLVMSAELPTANQKEKRHGYLSQEDVLVSECGAGLTLRGNLSALSMGSGKSRVFAKDLKLKIVEEDCL